MFRRAFEDPERDQFVAWDDYAAILVAGMGSFLQTHIDDPEMAELVTLLSSAELRPLAERRPRQGWRPDRQRHPEVGRSAVDSPSEAVHQR